MFIAESGLLKRFCLSLLIGYNITVATPLAEVCKALQNRFMAPKKIE
jgi:hypothetical protein